MNQEIVVGITTAPRQDCTLQVCAERVVEVGFQHPIIFAEPDSTPTRFLTYHNPKKLGAWHNWKNMVGMLLDIFPYANHFLLMQDDCYFVNKQTAEFTQTILYPKTAGFVSLYTPTQYAHRSMNKKKEAQVHHLQTQTSLGALAMVFPRKVLESFKNTRPWERWIGRRPDNNVFLEYERRTKDPSIVKHVDNAIGEMVKELNRTFWYVVPSLAKHIAEHSSLGHGPNKLKRQAEFAVSSDCSLLDLIPPPQEMEYFENGQEASLSQNDSPRRKKRDEVAWWSDPDLGYS